MLVLYVHFGAPDNAVHVDHGRHVLYAVRRGPNGSALFVVDKIEFVARRGEWFTAGPASVQVIDVTPAGVRLGFDAPADVRIDRAKVLRKRRRDVQKRRDSR